MRILLVTGRLARGIVEEVLARAKSKHTVDVVELPVQVIALLSTEDIAKSLSRLRVDVGKYDLIIIPGLCRGSARIISEKLGVPAVKGPVHADDLPLILGLDDPLSVLSPDEPADNILARQAYERNKRILEELEAETLEKGWIYGGLVIPIRPPPFRVISEISNAHRLTKAKLLGRAGRLLDDGADIISIGLEPLNPHPGEAYRLVRLIREEYDVPVAIDSLIPSEINAAVNAGASLVLSICFSNIDGVDHRNRGVPTVLIPLTPQENKLPENPATRTMILEKLLEKALKMGYEHPILDPVLDLPVIGKPLETLFTYKRLSEKHPQYPLMMGVGNITELVDADSPGMNMLLVLHALEAGISLLLNAEASTKTRGSTRELKIASQMVSIAYKLGRPPKDLGLDLLILKDKKTVTMKFEAEDAEVVDVPRIAEKPRIDPVGIYKIRVNHEVGVIEALYIGKYGKKLLRAKNASDLGKYITRNKLVSSLSHAYYLGSEIAKAEEALRIGKNYIQEKPLFQPKEPLKLRKHTLNQ